MAPATWLAVARALRRDGLRPLILGTGAELAGFREEAGEIDGAVYGDRMFGDSLRDMALSISLAALFAGHDSCPMHIASAFGIPTLGIFAPGEPARTFPQGVGPWRIIARASPADISAQVIMAEIGLLR